MQFVRLETKKENSFLDIRNQQAKKLKLIFFTIFDSNKRNVEKALLRNRDPSLLPL